jgi:hypothetical protein
MRIHWCVLLAKYYSVDKIKYNEMEGVYVVWYLWGTERCVYGFGGEC